MRKNKSAQEIQDDIFRKMSAGKKLEIASQLFLLGRKLDRLKKQKFNDTRRTSFKNRKDSKKS